MAPHWDLALTALSVAIGVLGAFAALAIGARAAVKGAAASERQRSLAGMAFAGAVWAKHVVALLAFDPGVPVHYPPGPILASLATACGLVGTGFALALDAAAGIRLRVAGGALVATGVVAVQAVGLWMWYAPGFRGLDWGGVLWVVALAGVLGGLVVQAGRRIANGFPVIAASCIGLGLCTLHWLSMRAAGLEGPLQFRAEAGNLLSPDVLAIVLAIVALGILGAALAASIVDNRVMAHLRASNQALEARVAARTRELLRAKLAAEDADVAKSRFLANMSHELRTPLNAVIGFSEMLELGYGGPLGERQAEYIGLIRTSAEHLLSLIGNVLDLSKVQAGEMEVRAVPTDLAALLDETLRIVAPLAARNRNHIERLVAPDVPRTVETDPLRLRQCLLNLLANACKFTNDGTIRLDVRVAARDREMLVIAVEDTGIGIPRSRQASLFDAFRQGDSLIAETHGGTGLGLALTAELMRIMGGRVDVESEVGVGSTFRLLLPIRKSAAADLGGRRVA